ncbi:efflux RND transporter permease subunit [Alteriqipengyuania lutimaris]|uniref:AcrB/AcrD/AcrF family protein n=1 Tax=Alteriqipengyuania lutimaris TaxID=1538146 RepID=A0A395LKN2_9SPHN|nr:efflux RND transporter permease subunit [Alteriqipengyuania lutimaris]MBB3033742.1 multidrug efflux pump subunit AcrB [Alteriqipengyuania lutimaris]RDS77275.1 AcrB/AcrD/AcrF family protein [Alteriqipengyuania lutimaris]
MSETEQDQPGGAVDRHGNEASDRARDRSGPIAFMARNGVAANLLLLLMLVAGYFSYTSIVQEVFPESSLDTITVSVTYPGATPEEIEESIVQKVEESVEAIEGVKEITATASEGRGSVNVELDLGSDIARALDEVKSEVDQIQTFPDEAEEPDIRELTTRQVVLRIALFGDVSERTLKETAYQLEDAASALPEISYVTTSAVRDYEIYADVPQSRLRALGLSLPQIAQIVGQSSLDTPAGAIETGSEEVRVRTIGQNYDQQDFENILVLTTPDGASLTLGDIADVQDGFEDADLITRFNDQPVAFVDIYRTSDERVLDVAEASKTLIESDFDLPAGVEYAIWEDSSELLQDRLDLLLRNAAFGLILVLGALTLFLDLRLAAWTAVGIGATFVGAIFILDWAGSSINMFSLFGFILALGLVVDDAVVVGENIYAERERGRTGMGAAIAGAQRVKVPVFFAVATTITAFLPLLAVGGVIGKILADIPLVVIAVLGLSLIEALYVLPHHLSTLPDPEHKAGNRVTRFFARVQTWVDARFQAFVNGPLDRALKFTVQMPYLILAGGVALLILFVAMLPAGIIKFSFFPEIEGDIVSATLEMPSGTTVERTAAVTERIEAAADRAIARFDGDPPGEDAPDNGVGPYFLEAVYTTIGLAQTGGGPGGPQSTIRPNLANVQVSLVPSAQREVSAVQIEEAWREELGEVPEARSLTISSSLLGLGEPVNVQLSHPDEAVLDLAADRLMNELSRVGGVFDIESDQDAGQQEIELRLKPSARSLGVTLQDVAGQVRAAFFGAEAVRVQRGREDVRVYIRLPEDERDSIADIESYRVRVPGGEVALSSLADVSFGEAPSVIRREGGRRITTITADVDSDTITGQEVAALLQEEIMPQLTADYPSLQYDFGGEQEEQQESFGDLGSAFLLALVAIYGLLAVPFRSYVQPLIIMAAIPFGMIGALIGHLLLGIPLGILSMFGIIALSGVIINGALVLIDFLNENLAAGMEPDEAVIDAAKSRFRPIMLTAITTFLGVAPITFETSLQAQFLIPMSASLGFGVLFGTALLILLIPALAIIQMRAVARIQRWRGRGRKETAPGGEPMGT